MTNPYEPSEVDSMVSPRKSGHWKTRVSWFLKMLAVIAVGYLMGAQRNWALLLLTMAVVGYCAFEMLRPFPEGED